MSTLPLIDEGTLPTVAALAQLLQELPANEFGAARWPLPAPSRIVLADWHRTLGSVCYESSVDDAHLFGAGDIFSSEFLVRVDDAFVLPACGLVASARGWIGARSAAEFKYFDPNLSAVGGLPDLARRAAAQRVADVLAPLPWGAMTNYGHFLFDALPAIVLALPLVKAGALRLLLPRLLPWHEDILDLVGVTPEHRVNVDDEVVRAKSAYYFSFLDHYLQSPGLGASLTAGALRHALQEKGVAPPIASERVFLTRRKPHKRPLLNSTEIEFEAACRGFAIVSAETLAPREQLAVLAQARLVAGVSGAAWGNFLAAPLHASAFEVMPYTFPSAWIRNYCGLMNRRWLGYVTPASATRRRSSDVVFGGKYLPNSGFVADSAKLASELDKWVLASSNCNVE